MFRNHKIVSTLAALGLLAALLASPALADGGRTIVGTWQVEATLDGSGQVDRILETYNREGTWISTGPTNSAGSGHGAWKRTSGRQFTTTNVIFGYGPDGNLAVIVTGNSEVEVSSNGNSYDGVFQAEVRDLSGNLLVVNSGTLSATRLEIDGDDDSDSDSDD